MLVEAAIEASKGDVKNGNMPIDPNSNMPTAMQDDDHPAATAAAARKANALRPDTKLFGDNTRAPMQQTTLNGGMPPTLAAIVSSPRSARPRSAAHPTQPTHPPTHAIAAAPCAVAAGAHALAAAAPLPRCRPLTMTMTSRF